MHLRINSQIFEKFSGLHLGVVVAKGIENGRTQPEVTAMLREQENKIRSELALNTLAEHSKIDAWRKAYAAFGAKPKKYHCSVENLATMILEGIELRSINPLVDLYNFISLKHLVPVGGDDLDKVEGDIVLTFAKGDELFQQLHSGENMAPHPGEVVYRDDKEVLCRRWNWRESEKSKMTESTKNVALVIEGLPPVTREEVEAATKELAELVQRFCGGKVNHSILDQDHPDIVEWQVPRILDRQYAKLHH